MPDFHIAEWYGHPFHELTDPERVTLAKHKVGGAALKRDELDRLLELEEKALQEPLSGRETNRLAQLRAKLVVQQREELPCPFKHGRQHATCTKPGGVCSIRLFTNEHGLVAPVQGAEGRLRALCPWRFHQNGTVFDKIGDSLLADPSPIRAGEVGFLTAPGNLDGQPGDDVGRIDMILVKSNERLGAPMDWVAVEVQAVYFSGKRMSIEFDALLKTQGRLSMPQESRRPDYRSSGVKRLLPQLQIKVPAISRWGKKTVVVVDVAFFDAMGVMERAPDVSNADIVWLLVDFNERPNERGYEVEVVEEVFTTLQSAISGLTGGGPVSKEEFERRIMLKI